MQQMKLGQQGTQGGCLRLLGYLLLALGIIFGVLVIASFGKLGSGNNSPQQLTALDDIQQYVFDTMAKPGAGLPLEASHRHLWTESGHGPDRG